MSSNFLFLLLMFFQGLFLPPQTNKHYLNGIFYYAFHCALNYMQKLHIFNNNKVVYGYQKKKYEPKLK